MVLINCRAAFAEEIDPHAQADEYFRQGRTALTRGDYNIAILLFRASQTIEPGRGKLVNIALCEEKLGLLMAATQHFQQVLPQLTPGDARLAVVQEHLTDLASRIPHLRVVLAAATPSGAIVKFEGAPLPAAALGTEIAVDPGTYVMTVSATGLPEKRYDVIVAEGKTVALTAELDKIAPPKSAPSETILPKPSPGSDVPHASSNKRTLGFFIGGAGMTSLAVGGVTGVLALVTRSSIESQCPNNVGCSREIVSKASVGKSLSVASALALSAGAIWAGAGIYLVLSDRKSAGAPTAGMMLFPDGGRVGISASF